jgi:hypothetical protein
MPSKSAPIASSLADSRSGRSGALQFKGKAKVKLGPLLDRQLTQSDVRSYKSAAVRYSGQPRSGSFP